MNAFVPRRRPVIGAVLLVVTACSSPGSHRTTATSLPPQTTEALTETVLTPAVQFGTRFSYPGYRRLESTAASAEVGFYWGPAPGDEPAGPAIIEFQRPGMAPECVEHAFLEFSADGAFRGDAVAVYPADPEILATPGGGKVPFEYLMDNRPRGVVRFDGLRGRADITDLYRTYLGKGVFPSRGRGFVQGSHPDLVVALQPENAGRPETFRLVTIGDGDRRGPLLRLWSAC